MVNGSNENIDVSRRVPRPNGRSPVAMTQFSDSHVLKSVNLRR